MKYLSKVIVASTLAVFVSGCAIPEQSDSGMPAWINNPGNGVVGSAGFNVNGKVAQEEAAVLRARTAYANGLGVSIISGQRATTEVKNDRASFVANGETIQTTNQKDVQVVIKARWHDVTNDTLWVWMVPTNSK